MYSSDPDRLCGDALLVSPQWVDWSSLELGEGWDTVPPDPEELPERFLSDYLEERFGPSSAPYEITRRQSLEEAFRDTVAEEPEELCPMMSYAYPLPHFPSPCGPQTAELAQARLMLCSPSVVVVELEGAPALALSGGGMDFSWEICEAYRALGYLPPVHFARNLPRDRSGKGPRDRLTLAAALRALQSVEESCARDARLTRERFGDPESGEGS